jgi:hypothetical protein
MQALAVALGALSVSEQMQAYAAMRLVMGDRGEEEYIVREEPRASATATEGASKR